MHVIQDYEFSKKDIFHVQYIFKNTESERLFSLTIFPHVNQGPVSQGSI